MKKLILVFAIMLSVFGCSKEEVKPVVVVPETVYYGATGAGTYEYYASVTNKLVIISKTKVDYYNNIFLVPASSGLYIGGNQIKAPTGESVKVYYTYKDNELNFWFFSPIYPYALTRNITIFKKK